MHSFAENLIQFIFNCWRKMLLIHQVAARIDRLSSQKTIKQTKIESKIPPKYKQNVLTIKSNTTLP